MEVDPATLLTLQSEFDDRPVMPDRLAVILVPGDIAPGAVEQMREREISVMSYKRLNDFDEFVRVEKRLIDAVRAFKKRLADPSHTEFTA